MIQFHGIDCLRSGRGHHQAENNHGKNLVNRVVAAIRGEATIACIGRNRAVIILPAGVVNLEFLGV